MLCNLRFVLKHSAIPTAQNLGVRSSSFGVIAENNAGKIQDVTSDDNQIDEKKALSPILRVKDKSSPTRRKTTKSTILSPPSPFKPLWADYDVMQNRWRYIRPFTEKLSDLELSIPANATDRWVKTQTSPVPIFGNIADATYFDFIMSPKQGRISPPSFSNVSGGTSRVGSPLDYTNNSSSPRSKLLSARRLDADEIAIRKKEELRRRTTFESACGHTHASAADSLCVTR
jgi:hypothetical protein